MKQDQVKSLIEAMFDRHVARVIERVKALPPEARQSGDDSPLSNVWEEWVVQMRGEHSVLYDLYEQTIRAICRDIAAALPREEQGLLWQLTDIYFDHDGDDIPFGGPVLDALEAELFQRTCANASNMTLPDRLDRYVNPPPDQPL